MKQILLSKKLNTVWDDFKNVISCLGFSAQKSDINAMLLTDKQYNYAKRSQFEGALRLFKLRLFYWRNESRSEKSEFTEILSKSASLTASIISTIALFVNIIFREGKNGLNRTTAKTFEKIYPPCPIYLLYRKIIKLKRHRWRLVQG